MIYSICVHNNLNVVFHVVTFIQIVILVSGDSNFSMEETNLVVGGFSQPSVARALIEFPGNTEKGFSQRFLWIFPEPSYAHFESLESVNKSFTGQLGMCITFTIILEYECFYLHVIPVDSIYIANVFKTCQLEADLIALLFGVKCSSKVTLHTVFFFNIMVMAMVVLHIHL